MSKTRVEYNFLGKSGLNVSNICLGTMTFGKNPNSLFCPPTQANEEKSHQIMDKYAELGGNFIDTANVYGAGLSEQIIGNWLKKHDRSKFVVATKVRFPMDMHNVNKQGLSRRHMLESCDESIERLQTPYIDLFQSHLWDEATPIDETLRTFDDLIRCGKIRYFGVSNVCGWQLQKIVDRVEAMGLNSCVSLQQQYNLLARKSELEEFRVCRNERIGVLTWSPLKGGLLTGRHKRGDVPSITGSRIGHINSDENSIFPGASEYFWSKYAKDDAFWKLNDLLRKIADKHGKSIAQVSLRWLLQQDIVASVIVGATTVKQLEENMGAASGWEMTAEEIDQLNDAGNVSVDYPHDWIAKYNYNRQNKFNKTYVK